MAPLADRCLYLDINKLKRDGMLVPGRAYRICWWLVGDSELTEIASLALFCWSTLQVRLIYCLEGGFVGEIGLDGRGVADVVDSPTLDDRWLFYSVPIVYTRCNFGGWRPWFRCPGSRCGGRRVGKLYLGNRYFLCRHCYRLRYECQFERDRDRLLRRREKLERRLAEDGWSRPKGMHRRTYDRLVDELISIEDRLEVAMIERWAVGARSVGNRR